MITQFYTLLLTFLLACAEFWYKPALSLYQLRIYDMSYFEFTKIFGIKHFSLGWLGSGRRGDPIQI